ncbi:MAG TPA: AAA family ATPase [Rhizomicrobium sp.]|nr:AAA family ATPase [Rhizomicrobium sp.]
MADDQTEIVDFLSTPAAYGLTAGPVERHSTHGSIVFLAGGRAYKLKRAVRYDYMDYSTPEKRRAMCEAELAVNRRTAPELYLEVRPLIREGGTLRIGAAGEQEGAIDWLVAMRRFDQQSLLEEMRKRGALDLPLMRTLAERIAAFHASAEVTKGFGGAAGIAEVIAECGRMFVSMMGAPFDPAKIERWLSLANSEQARLRGLLEARRDSGCVRRCHGDLHLNNICLVEGRPVLFDAIEFRDDFSCIDVLYDLAFLLMDLDSRDLRALANAVFNRYLERSGDYSGLGAMPLFLSCRAAVRAHVAVSAAKFGAADREERHREAVRLLDRAIGYLAPRQGRIVAIAGLSGTGKSTLAASIAPLLGCAPGAIVVRTDVIRKSLWGADDLTRLPQEAYAREFTAKVYAALIQRVETVARGGYVAIADAVFGQPFEREAVEAAARRAGVPFKGLWLAAPVDVLERRIASRRHDASDATVEVLRTQLRHIREPENWIRIDASSPDAQAHVLRASTLSVSA